MTPFYPVQSSRDADAKTPTRRQQADWMLNTPRPRVLISGYYGFDNLGDDLILKVLCDALLMQNVAVTVLSQNPEDTEKRFGVRAVRRTNLIDIIDAIIQTNLFVSGGGGLFQDATGPASPFYYGGLIRLARLFDVPVCFWSQGVGPLAHPTLGWATRAMTRWSVKGCEAITVRDVQSAQLITSLGLPTPPVTADPVWLLKLPTAAPTESNTGYTGSDSNPRQKPLTKTFGISLRPWHELTENRLEAFSRLLIQIANKYNAEGYACHFALFAFQHETDWRLLSEFKTRLQILLNQIHQKPAIEMSLHTYKGASFLPQDPFWQALAHCDAFFGMRYHSLVLALLAGKPVYALSYDPKVQSLIDTLRIPGCPVALMEGLRADGILDALMRYDFPDLTPLKTKAWANLHLLEELIQQSADTGR
ncbi:MAG: polysaccharide pyruvyl transferase CsaB [Vampirovibrionales bacterium]|nr:polysaccharide pyruvyl transferase CsaB [Vampirovibrionales bacterium]